MPLGTACECLFSSQVVPKGTTHLLLNDFYQQITPKGVLGTNPDCALFKLIKKISIMKKIAFVLALVLSFFSTDLLIAQNRAVGYSATDEGTLYVSTCLLYTSPSPRDLSTSRMPSSA